MFRRKIETGLLVLALLLSMIPQAHGASAAVHITARVRAKVSVAVVSRDGIDALLVKANIPWTVSVRESGPGGVLFRETFSGARTTESGTLVPTVGRIEDFTALAVP